MSAPRLLPWIRSLWKDPLADPFASYGPEFIGIYEPSAGRVVGSVKGRSRTSRYLPASIVVVRDGEQIGTTERFERHGDGWRFDLKPDSQFTKEDILQDRIRAFVIDQFGRQHQLKIDGIAQFRYVMETVAPTELVIDFSQGGNSGQYLLGGWSDQELGHIWTLGKASTVAITFAKPGSRYGLEMVASPFVVHEKLPRQIVEISVCGSSIAAFSLGAKEPVPLCSIPGELTTEGKAILRFDHPNAARPCDVTSSKETQERALAVKELRLRRYLEAP